MAMAQYKRVKYGSTEESDERNVQVERVSTTNEEETWMEVDNEMQNSIEIYQKYQNKYDIFLTDFIVKLVICRAYLNIKAKKLLTAEKILKTAKILI